MKESIKKRIEAVHRGKVPEGYVSKNHQLRPADWKYEKIGKYLVPYDEFSNDTEAYPLATSSRQGLMLQSEYYIDQRYEETTGGFHVVPVGYVTYRHMSDDDIFRFNLNKIGKPVLVSPEYPVFTTTGGLNQDLLVAYLNGMKEFQAFCSAQKKGSTRTRMYFHRLCEFTIPIPSITEQQKIAEILETCDRIIELKQSKIDELNKLKQVCLLEMFPQKGKTIPKRRFPGFSAPWEQRKLGEVGSVSMCRRIFKEQTSESGDIPFYKIGTFGGEADAFISKELFEEYKAKYPYPKKGDILISASGSIGRTVEFTGENEYFQDSNIVWLNHDEHLDNSFLKCFYSAVKWAGIEGSTIKRLYNDNILNTVITLPSVAEQKKIGSYFANLDRLITLHQCELAEVGKYKKALMQLLLTGLVRVNA